MPTMIQPEVRFNVLRERWRIMEEKRAALQHALFLKHRSFTVYDHQLTAAERKKRESLERTDSKLSEAMCMLLDEYSPRRWRSGVPLVWIMEHLTWADAITMGALSVVPPAAWGMTQADMQRFAAPITREKYGAA